MHVLLINGSPHEKGCTYTALSEVAGALEKNGVETEIFHIGTNPVRGCTACLVCRKGPEKRCVFNDDPCNALIDRAKKADGIVIGSPVYYAGPNGALLALVDRLFYAGGSFLAYKPGAAVFSCRRGGASAAFDRMNKYFTINKMPVVSSQYWNAVHGSNPDQVRQDLEGLQIMRTLGNNMAWLIKSLAHEPRPELETPVGTNFIR